MFPRLFTRLCRLFTRAPREVSPEVYAPGVIFEDAA